MSDVIDTALDGHPNGITIKVAAAEDKSGMTLDELDAWIRRVRALGLPGSAVVYARTRMGMQIREVEVRS